MATVICGNCRAQVSSILISCPTCAAPIGYDGSAVSSSSVTATEANSSREPLLHDTERSRYVIEDALAIPIRPLRLFACVAIAALAFMVIALLLAIPADIEQVDITQRLLNNEPVTINEILNNDDERQNLRLVYLAAFVACALTFLVWIYRAYSNLDNLGVLGLDYSLWWTVGRFLVPILNFWRPYKVMRELWRAGEGARIRASNWRLTPAHAALSLWWALWIAGVFVGGIVVRAFDEPTDLTELRNYAYATLAVDLLLIPTAVLAIWLVWRITRTQEVAQALFPPGRNLGLSRTGENHADR